MLLTDTKTVSNASALLEATDAPQAHLFVVMERGRPLAGGARHSLANIDRITIGRGSERRARRCIDGGQRTLAMTVPDARISSKHATLERRGKSWTLIDHASTNGSRINRARVTSAPLADGDLFELGQTLFRLRTDVPTPVNAVGDADAADLTGVARAFGTLLPWLARDLETVARVARSDVSVLLLGETGTGKEVLARAIHTESRRAGAFVAVNCGALPPALVESLLFGHKKGAFSGAAQDEIGLVRAADGGTLFLDEIGDLPKASQAALLRILQEREVVPVGATRAVPIDLRVVAATHCPLAALAQTGEFRSDLLARLSGFTYAVPPLRDRIDDIGTIVASLLRKLHGESVALSLGTDAALAIIEDRWPLNVRELEHRLKVSGVLADGGRIDLASLTRATTASGVEPTPARAPKEALTAEEQALRAELLLKMREHKGNVTHVGEAMGKARTQVQRWMRRFGIDPLQYR